MRWKRKKRERKLEKKQENERRKREINEVKGKYWWGNLKEKQNNEKWYS